MIVNKNTRMIVIFSLLLIVFSSVALANEFNITINAVLNDYNDDFSAQTDPNANAGYDGYDLDAPSLPLPYSSFYSKITGHNLVIDVWNQTIGKRILNLTYLTTDKQSGSLNLSWTFSDPSFVARLTDYGYDPTYTNPNGSTMDIGVNSSYNISVNGSNRYFKLEVYDNTPLTGMLWVDPTPTNNKTTNLATHTFNMTCIGAFIDTVWIDLNGTINKTPQNDSSGNYWWTLTRGEGTYNYTGYCNNSAGKINNTEPRTLNIDLTAPAWSDNITYPASGVNYAPGANYQFNITWIDNYAVDKVIFEFNGANYTDAIKSGYVYSKTISNLGAGIYNYVWYANDTSGNANQSILYNETNVCAGPEVTIEIADDYCSIQTDFGEVWCNSLIECNWSSSDSLCVRNLSFVPALCASFTNQVDCTSYYAGYACSNWTLLKTPILTNYTVNPGTPILTLTASPYWENIYGTETIVNCTSDTPEVVPMLYRNGTYVGGSYDIETLAAGSYNYTCNSSETPNYTVSEKMDILNVTPGSTVTIMYLNGSAENLTITYGLEVNASAVTSNGSVQIYRDGNPISNPNISTLAAGYHNYTAINHGNENFTGSSATLFLNVTQASPTCSLVLTPPSVTYNATVNASCSCTNIETISKLYRNGTNVDGENNNLVTLGAGTYSYVCNSSETENYTNASANSLYTISRLAGNINLYLDGLRSNLTKQNNSNVNISAVLVSGSGNIQVYSNGNLLYNGSSPSQNITAFNQTGLYNITSVYIGNDNYTRNFETWWINITPIPNIPPNTTQIILNSSLGNNWTNEDLNCYANITDIDLDSVSANYTWYNGTTAMFSGQTSIPLDTLTLVATLYNANTSIGENWTCSVQAYDGNNYEGDWNNATLTIIAGCGDSQITAGEDCEPPGTSSCNANCKNIPPEGPTCSPVNSDWSAWSAWSDTSAWSACTSCSQSKTQQRTRSCVGTASCGGTNGCIGSSTETQTVSQACGKVAGGWSAWSACSCPAKCQQTRTCDNPLPACGGTCSGLDTQPCNGGNCCVPNCVGKSCGDDGCGGSCVTCSTGSCQNGQCVPAECGDDNECPNGFECIGDSCEREMLSPEKVESEIAQEKELSLVTCVNITRVTGEKEVSMQEGQIDESLIPEGYNIIVNPFHMDCSGESFKFSVAIPENYDDVKVLKCLEGQCSSEQAEYVTELKCGDEIVQEVKRETKVFDPKLASVEITETKVDLGKLKQDIESGNNKIQFLGEEFKGIVSVNKPSEVIEEAKNQYLKIIGAPIIIQFETKVQTGINTQITMPYTTSENYEESSIAMYIKQDEQWVYLENSTIDYDNKLVTSIIENISEYTDSENKITLALMGVLIAANKNSELKNVYYPVQGTKDMLIFVHGVGSSPETYQSMIDDMRLTKQPISLYTFGYSLTKSIDDIAKDFSNLLESNSENYDNIYIIAHSAGGLIAQQALYDADNSGTYSYIQKVKKAVLIASPNDGSPLAAVYKRLFESMVNEESDYPLFNIKSETMDDLVKGRLIPQVKGIDYYVIAGTKPYELDVAFFKENRPFQEYEVSDGVVTIKSAQHVGESYISQRGKNYWEIYLTHNELIKDPLARKIIEKIVARDILKVDSILGSSKYYELSITSCSPDELYVVIGKRIDKREVVDPTLFECGNGICDHGETKESCPEDCAVLLGLAKREDLLPFAGYIALTAIILFLILEALKNVKLIIYAKTKANKNELFKDFYRLSKSASELIMNKEMVKSDNLVHSMKKDIAILQYITPGNKVKELKSKLKKLKISLNNIKKKNIELYREQLAEDTKQKRQNKTVRKKKGKQEPLTEKKAKVDMKKRIIDLKRKEIEKRLFKLSILRKLFKPKITAGYVENRIMRLHDSIDKCKIEIDYGKMIHPRYQVKLFLDYEKIYSDLIKSKIENKEKIILSNKMKRVYNELKNIQSQKPKKIPKEISREIVRPLAEYKVSQARQLKDLTKRYEKLAKKIDNKKLEIREELDAFMEYSRLYSDLAMSSLDAKEKARLTVKLKDIYKRLKSIRK